MKSRISAATLSRLIRSHELLLYALREMVRCIRRGDLGDYSPMMDEIFDSEAAIKTALKVYNYQRKKKHERRSSTKQTNS